MPIGSQAKRNDRHNIISLVAGELVWLERGGANPPDVLVASEYAPVFIVDLPLAQHRTRVAALPFAIEDRIAQPIDELHVALGPEVAPRRYLAAVVAGTRMTEWQARLAAHRITPRRIIPDATMLAPPEGDAGWAVRIDGDRVLVRTREQEAFATSIRLFDALWIAAGKPALQQAGPDWPAAFPDTVARPDTMPVTAQARHVIDLMQGARHTTERRYDAPLKAAAVMIACAAVAHAMILSLDAAFAAGGVAQRRAEVVRLLASVAPLGPASDDPAATLAAMLPDGTDNAGASHFLFLLSRVSSSIQPDASGMAVQALSYDEADGALLLKIEAADLPALERIKRNLTEDGFDAQSGSASVGDGRAESSITVREAGVAGGDR